MMKTESDRSVRLTVVSILILVPGTVFWGQSGRAPQPDNATTVAKKVESDAQEVDVNNQELIDQKYRDLLVGRWTRQHHGKRSLIVNSDNTATMVIEPSAFYSFVFGKKLTIELAWKIKGGHAIYNVTGGSPEGKLKLAAKTWGDRWDEPILELTDERLVLENKDGTKSKWTRVASESDRAPRE